MLARVRAALLAQAVASALVAPVYSLVLLSRGATLSALSLCIAAQMVSVVVLEVPSGVLSDLLGRKRLFVSSCLAALLAYLVMLVGRGFPAMALACVLRGVSQAASSGTLDALYVEEALRDSGESALERAVSSLQLMEGVGAAVAALAVGPLVALDPAFAPVLVVAVALEALLAVYALLVVRETPSSSRRPRGVRAVGEQVRGVWELVRGSADILPVMLMFAVLGMTLGSTETYWQSSYSQLVSPELLWSVSVVSCLGYGAANLGVWLSRRVWESRAHTVPMRDRWRALVVCRLAGAALIACLGAIGSPVCFAVAYALAYLVSGAGNVMDTSIVQASVANEQRASVSSLTSLCVRGGGLALSAVGLVAIGACGLAGAWVVFGALVAGGTVAARLLTFLHTRGDVKSLRNGEQGRRGGEPVLE